MILEHKSHERTLEACSLCIDSRRLAKHCVIAVGIKTYLSSAPWHPLVEGHTIIVPSGHYASTVSLDEDVYDEMRIWRKGLVAMWKSEDMDCLFIETAKNVKYGGHMYVECIPLPLEVGETAPIYFKKAINDSEGEWCDNKKLLELSASGGDIRRAIPKGFSYFAVDFGLQPGYAHIIEDENRFPNNFAHKAINDSEGEWCDNKKLLELSASGGDIRRAIPKGFSYFAVDFGLQPGYAHIIEDENRFPNNFAHEIIGGMLDLDHTLWRKPEKIGLEEQKKNADRLKQLWTQFDWTEKYARSVHTSASVSRNAALWAGVWTRPRCALCANLSRSKFGGRTEDPSGDG
ncbi:CWF19-like protein 2 -like protein [Toxocara canis]|uniref:CWF19-like protein 2-like protein n=1 Tax=Toxocara canis TaxID=6265 RepID=A0A0B2V0X4_TOXCA|nr:CWF19-like protein 2 -like protein [Toxocara canis]